MDFSSSGRFGLRGINASKLLKEIGLDVPNQINSCVDAGCGYLNLRVAENEYWLCSIENKRFQLSQGKSKKEFDLLKQFEKTKINLKPNEYFFDLPLQFSHAQLMLKPASALKILPKLCAIDLSESAFKAGDVVQTSMAKISVIIAKFELKDTFLFLILCDSAYAQYLWQSIVRAEQEFI